MAKPSYPRAGQPLPAPLPPETRTVGQLVAETIRFFGQRFWAALAIGLPLTALDAAAVGRSIDVQVLLQWAFGPALTLAFVCASALVHGVRLTPRTAATAFAVGLVIYLPFPLLYRLYILPGLALFAFAGMAVPAAVVEGSGFRAALRRGVELGRADFIHALGGLATLVLVYGLSRGVLFLLLHTQSDQTLRVAGFLADLVLAPIIFLGSALLYSDQAARVVVDRSARGR
jgi:hypothetical protein